ncbi:MAG: RNA-dependent RNA polymerase [Coniothyrium diplodiella chrysovirus 1]|uniref:RNA-dependent RNA polymerase n=1 Tax=Coniothyrium diplodiella chrysovirus 1 TaxID=2587540 RepID=UPI001BE57067|nr:MAG: RNA-dependent RNA polymerase [Coniothyrium diplodiella chrysovirus 1]QDB74971.1 MAG: RNA-dependent RNA polymerase [Coniothyrium diplodiella chrysovirus 1]
MPDSPTVGASYSGTPLGRAGTLLTRAPSPGLIGKWSGLVAVVLPMCNGKSTCAMRFGGYDIDDVVVNDGELRCDKEYDVMIGLREAGLWDMQEQAMYAQNQLLLRRARRFFEQASPDGNALILYVHTAELASALGIPIVFAGAVDSIGVANSERVMALSDEERRMTLRVAREQTGANNAFCRRHNLDHHIYSSYSSMVAEIESALVRSGHYVHDQELDGLLQATGKRARATDRLDGAMRVIKRREGRTAVKAVAARAVIQSLGGMAPQEAHLYHNHPAWARAIQAGGQAEDRSVSVATIRSWSEAEWKEKFPFGPGNSAFALCKLSDWVDATSDEELEQYYWFRQSCALNDVRYERLLSMALYCDAAVRSARKGDTLVLAVMKSFPLGALNTEAFMEVAQHMHNITRISCTYMCKRVPSSMLPRITYLHCLSGRNFGVVDMDKEIADRTSVRTPKWYFVNGHRSEREFDKRFTEAVRKSYDYLGTKTLDSMLRVFDEYPDFDTFMEKRKMWVRAGSATGSPKTDIKLKVPAEMRYAVEELSQDVLECGFRVITNVRLNKAAAFEFKEFPALVKKALGDYVPNSFTRHFTKHEVGKPEGRALYPSHLLHYIVMSYLLTIAEKGGSMPGTRLLSPTDQQAEDHLLWREARDVSVGLMLDYANFNEQHEIKHMRTVISELGSFFCKFHGLSKDVQDALSWASDALDNIVFEYGDKSVYFLHGLLSGWRNTTWNNSVINRANKLVIAQQVKDITGVSVLTEFQSGGDDVASEERSYHDAAVILRVGEAMGFEFKAIKQLVSSSYVEFYRLFVSKEGVFGSLCRMLGSAASGQWSNSVIAKFVDPASKLNSIIEIARKAGRRSLFDMSYAEKIAICAFKKWATYDDIKLADELIHGTIETGGLGVPKVDGTVYELERFVMDDASEEKVELVGLPSDASRVVAEKACAEVSDMLGAQAAEDPKLLAQQMSSAVFMGALGSSEGARTLQKLNRKAVYTYKPRVRRVKTIPAAAFAQERSGRYMRDKEKYAEAVADYRRAKKRYSSLVKACKGMYKEALALKITDGTNCDFEKLIAWCDRITMYGCATYMLTEDYYETVMILALHTSDGTEDGVAWHAARYACGLANDGYLFY